MTCVCNPRWNEWVPMIERRIIGHAIRTILVQGLNIAVYDGEDFALKASTDADDIIGVIGDTDISIFNIHNSTGFLTGYIVFIHGNREDVLSDYSMGDEIEKIVARIEAEVEAS